MDWIAKEYEGKVEVKKIDVDENGALTSKYMVYNLPAIFLEKDGKVVGKWSGLTSRDVLLKAIAEAA
jgi:thioredoxin 1